MKAERLDLVGDHPCIVALRRLLARVAASRGGTGLIEQAHGGTVHLDEVRELDPVMQAKILTRLYTQRFRRVGAVNPITSNVRFVAATNRSCCRRCVRTTSATICIAGCRWWPSTFRRCASAATASSCWPSNSWRVTAASTAVPCAGCAGWRAVTS